MRVRLAVAAASLLFLCAFLGGAAAADRVRTTKSTKVYKRTGEQSGIVTKVASGKTLEVIAKQGRWLKVRVNGRTGWVTQSSVVALEARDIPRNTRRRPFVDGRSTRRGWGGGAPDDRVGADAVEDRDDSGGSGDGDDDSASSDDDDETGRGSRASRDDDDDDDRRRTRSDRDDDDNDDDDGDDGDARDRDDDDGDDGDSDEADTLKMVTVTAKKAKLYPRMSKKSKAILTVRRGAQLVVLDEHESGKWIRVEDDEGSAGWILADAVSGDGGGARKKRALGATARMGFASVGGTFKSNATAPAAADSPPPDYSFGSTAVSLAVGGEFVMAYSKAYYLGASLDYLGCVATPGIRYTQGQMAQDIGFKTHDIDARLLGGYDFRKSNGMTAWLRLGYHYGAFQVSNLDNLAKLPSENFKGPTFGVALRIPMLTKKIGAEASLDVVYPGSRAQTVGRTDGTLDKAKAASLGLLGAYDWKGAWKIEGGYHFGYAATRWTGTSDRVTGAMGAATISKRTDLSHVVTVGLGRAF